VLLSQLIKLPDLQAIGPVDVNQIKRVLQNATPYFIGNSSVRLKGPSTGSNTVVIKSKTLPITEQVRKKSRYAQVLTCQKSLSNCFCCLLVTGCDGSVP